MVAWSLCVFAGGVAGGPALQDYAYQGIEAGAVFLHTNLPPSWARYVPSLPEYAVAPSYAAQATPLPPPAEPTLAPEPSPVAPPTRPEPDRRVAPAVESAEPALPASEPAAVPVKPLEAAAKAPVPERSLPSTTARERQDRRQDGHKDSHKDKHKEPANVAPGARKTVPVASRPEAAAAPEPAAPKSLTAPKSARSRDGLDGLMAGMANEGGAKSKGSRSTSKDIDAMLKDVQKSNPAPAPKRIEPPEAPPLTSADIARAMAGVKTSADACGKRLGQTGVADLKLTVGKDGKVNAVSVGGKAAGTPLAGCIEKSARAVTFRPNAGLKFDYRIDVH